MLKRFVIFLLIYPLALCAYAQRDRAHTEGGIFYNTSYTPAEYGSSFQNWVSLETPDGLMVFANGDGILTYDGKKWTLIETPTQSVIRAVAIDSTGKIYAGGLDDFGYLEQVSDGGLKFNSLLPKLKPDLRRMGSVSSIYTKDGKIYYEAETGLFCWNGNRLDFWRWPDPTKFHKSFFWNNDLFAYEEGAGLLRFNRDKFSLAQGGDFFKALIISTTLALDNNMILLGTRYNGLFIYDGKQVRPYAFEGDAYIRSNQLYSSAVLPDSRMVLGTRLGGALIVDAQGKIHHMLTKETGIPSNFVMGITVDGKGDLWLALDYGITHVEISNGLTFYNKKMGLDGTPNEVYRYNGKLYVATNIGTYYLQPADFPSRNARFEKLPLPHAANCWNFLEIDHRLLISSNQGLFEINKDIIHKITDIPSYALHRYKGDNSRILIAHDHGFQSLRLKNGIWSDAGWINDITLDNVRFNETREGYVWVSTFSQGATLMSFPRENGKVNYDQPTVETFGPAQGLTEGFIKINNVGNKELFRVGTASKLFRFDYSSKRFLHDSAFASTYGLKNGTVFPISNEDESGKMMMKTKLNEYGGRQLIVVNRSVGNSYTKKIYDLSRIFESVGVMTYPENDDMVWHMGSGVIVRQELSEARPDTATFHTYLNKIIVADDSVFFQGIGGIQQESAFPYASGSFRFEFTANHFVAEEKTKFQYRLEGFDEDWSDWSKETIKEYSRLWEGDYTFMVRSRNYAGTIGETDVFHFTVSPPWYRSIWAYLLYTFTVIAFVWGLIRWRSAKLEEEKKALQAEIAVQTQEIREQNIQLASQSEELKTSAEQLKQLDALKSNFFVNISHEFRTPLSLILGPLEKHLQENDPKIRFAELERMHRNGKRLQQLINQLLDLAKLESGGMGISLQPGDFIYFSRVLTASFESLAEIRNIHYTVTIPSHAYDVDFDREKVETVFYNLLSNAFKFTPEGGRIDVAISLPQNGDTMIKFAVTDTGPGIPTAHLDKIFDRFYQVDGSSSREYEGSGIGLSLVKELVSLLKGTIGVQSKMGTGTTFTVQLPLEGVLTMHSAVEIKDEKQIAPADTLMSTAEESSEFAGTDPVSSRPLVLLIEDNEDLRGYLKENLEDDYQVVVGENGQIGLEKALELTPDLILSDMMMPVMDGFTLCTKIREDERTSHIPFILLTARTTVESKLEGLELGADEYMTKPFNIKEIKVRIKNLLEQRKKLRRTYGREITLQPKNIAVTSVDERFLEQVLAILEAHLADPQFSVESFADAVGMSRKNLLRKIKALTDQSVNEFIRNFRLKRAAQLIEGQAATVSEIAYQVGFNNLSYFSKCFKEVFGVLPTEYAGKKSLSI